MSLELLWDPLFRAALLTGLVLSVVLPLLGAYLHLRREWLATLGLSHVAAGGGIVASVLGWPLLVAAFVVTALAAAVKSLLMRPGNDRYVILMLAGWAFAILAAGASHQSELLAQSLMRGQLYFVSMSHVWTALALLVLVAVLLPWLSPRLQLERFFPDHFSANRRSPWPHRGGFELLVVSGVVLGIVVMGVMAAFALIFVPAWVAFHLARGWRQALALCVGFGVVSYLLAYGLAIVFDQPFGPVLVAVLLGLALLRLWPRGIR